MKKSRLPRTKTERIYCQQTYNSRNVKENSFFPIFNYSKRKLSKEKSIGMCFVFIMYVKVKYENVNSEKRKHV